MDELPQHHSEKKAIFLLFSILHLDLSLVFLTTLLFPRGAYFLIEVCNVFLKGKIEFRYNDKNDNFS